MSEEIFEFEKLRVYQKSLDFTAEVYNITKSFPPEERFGLTGQFRRAVVSIVLNIAEGSDGTKAELKHFLKIVRRSVRESVAVLEISFHQKYVSQSIRQEIREDCVNISRMITGLLKSLSPNDER
jgi:four helix bundle protein